MFAAPASLPVSMPSRPGWRRVAGILALSALLHFVLLNWSEWHLPVPAGRTADAPPVVVRLLRPAPAMKPAPAPRPQPKPARKSAPHRLRPKAAPAPAPKAEPVSPAIPDAAPLASSPGAALAAPTGDAATEIPARSDATNAGAPPQDSPAATAADAAPAPAAEMPPALRVEPPPSARLVYDVQALRQGQKVYGHGRIDWRIGDGRYRVDGEAGVLFFNVLEFHSDGEAGDGGIAPLLYTEKRFRKPETDTHFQREPNLISFSASTMSYPRTGSEQDRASIIWQLAGIGRGDPQAFAPGTEIDVFVAAVRDGDTWRIRVVGEEDVEIDGAMTHTWHLVREPRPGSYDQKLDMWFAPQRHWYPVRLRYTEPGGDFLDMFLTDVGALPS